MAVDNMLLDQIYDNAVYIVEALNPTDKGDRYIIECPECGEREAWIYKKGATGRIFCNRKNNCTLAQNDKGLSLWDYIQEREGLDQQETLKRLAEMAGVDLPSLSDDQIEAIRKKRLDRDLVEEAHRYFKELLFTEDGAETLAYLKDRGYTERDIQNMELGHYPGYGKTIKHLANMGFQVSPLPEVFEFAKSRGEYKVIFPYRDVSGKIKTFYGRLTRKPQDKEAKYLNFGPVKKDIPFNMHKAKGSKTLILVEGYFDALIATSRGSNGVIAVQGANLTEDNLRSLQENNIKNVVITLDSDNAGQKGIEKAIKTINQKCPSITPFVATLPEGQDPDDVITKSGITTLMEYVKNCEAGPIWVMNRILNRYPIDTELGKKEAFDAILDYMRIVPRYWQTQIKDHIGERLNYPIDDIEEMLKYYLNMKDREELQKEYTKAFQKALSMASNEDPFKAKDFMKEQLEEIGKKETKARGGDLPEPYSMVQLKEDLLKAPEGLKTGIRGLDKYIGIPSGAITIIAGRPGHGKTTLQLNLLMNMVEEYPDRNFYFFSYEEDRHRIGIKLLMMMSEYVLDHAKNNKAFWKYIAGGETYNTQIEEAKAKLDTLLESGRLNLIYKNHPADQLSDVISQCSEEGNAGAVFVDYIQKIPAPMDSRYWSAQQKIQSALEVLRDTSVNSNIPLIMGAQLRRFAPGSVKGKQQNNDNAELAFKLDNLRESGDIEQDANLVLGVYNDSSTKAEDGDPLGDEAVTLNIGVLKNRDGRSGIRTEVDFYSSYFKIKDKRINLI
jgi:DNA primase catalytic core